jgi:hypothetical protein
MHFAIFHIGMMKMDLNREAHNTTSGRSTPGSEKP